MLINYSTISNTNEEFSILDNSVRASIIEDLFEFDKCFYLNNYSIEIYSKEEGNKKKKRTFIGKLKNKMKKMYKDIQLSAWDTDVMKAIFKKCGTNELKSKIEVVITEKGIPMHLRPKIWKKLVGNNIKMNKPLFSSLMKKAVKTFKGDCLIKKDIDRTFFYFTKSEEFTKVLAESTLLLEMFTLYRPDIMYIQGMSYVMTMLLLHYKPYSAFKVFCNLILGKEFLYKTYIFKKKYIERIQSALEYIVSKNYPRLYRYLTCSKLEIWSIYWIEWIYAMFLRTFDLKTCLILWDLILLKDDLFIFKLNLVVFGILNEKFDEIDKTHFFEKSRMVLLANQDKIVSKAFNDSGHDFDLIYIKKIIEGG